MVPQLCRDMEPKPRVLKRADQRCAPSQSQEGTAVKCGTSFKVGRPYWQPPCQAPESWGCSSRAMGHTLTLDCS